MGTWLPFALLACLSSGILAEDHNEDSGEGGGERGEEQIPKADVMVAGMLLVSVTYMMFTLGMANQGDRTLKKLTWTALHTKISIFCAVLIYQGVVALFGEHGYHGVTDGSLRQIISAGFGWFLWFTVLQVLMASLSFEIFSKKVWRKRHGEDEEAWEERRAVLMEFWGVLLGHITGFASIAFWANVQERFYKAYNTHGVLLVILVAICVQMGWVIFVRKTRRRIVAKYDPNAEANTISKFAKVALERWNEKTIETENDSMALTLSFMIVQAIRVSVTTVMPDPEGLEERGGPAETGPLRETHTISQCFLIVFWGVVVFATVLVWRDWQGLASSKESLERRCEERDVNFERITEVASDTGSMVLAWSLFFFGYTFLDTLNQDVFRPLAGSHHGDGVVSWNCGSGGMTGGILLAMCTTVMAYFAIFLSRQFDLHMNNMVDPTHHQSKTAHDIILSVMKASGLLIGFGWEKAFDKAVEDLSDQAGSFKGVLQFVISGWIFAVVGFIWMWYILPTVMEYNEDDETKRELREKFKVRHDGQSGMTAGSRVSHLFESFLGRVRERRLDAAKEEFETDLADMQEKFEEYVETTRRHFQTLRDEKYQEDRSGHPINTGKSRADHKNHMRRLLKLQKQAAEYSFFELTQPENPGTRQSQIAAMPYLPTNV